MTAASIVHVLSVAIVTAFAPLVVAAQARAPRDAIEVTRENFIRAESDRYFYSYTQQAGGVNRFFHVRLPTPLDRQGVVRMNKDTLYSAAIVDTSKGASVTLPAMPDGRYASILVLDNDHYVPLVIYDPGTHRLPQDTRYLFLAVRIQVLRPDDPQDIAVVNRLQDQLRLSAGSATPFAKPRWDGASLDALRARYEREFSKFDRYPDEWQGRRGEVNEKTRHLAAAGAWGLFPNRDATYINYNADLPAKGCHGATYRVPDNRAFWSITVYGDDGYMKSENSVLNGSNVELKPDGTFDARFGSRAACGDVTNRLDISDGWNFLMRIYRPGPSVSSGVYKLPDVSPVARE